MEVATESTSTAPQAELYSYYSGAEKSPLGSLPADDLELATSAITKILKSTEASTAISRLIEGPSFPPVESRWEVSLAEPPAPSKNSVALYLKELEKFDLKTLDVNTKVLEEFQSAEGSRKQHRLLEIVCTAIHYFAIDLYKTNNPPPATDGLPSDLIPPPYPAIAHSDYYATEPWKKIWDYKAVGFWAEAQTFGGVVYFDRTSSSSEKEYQGVWLHGLPNTYTNYLWQVPDDVVSAALEAAVLPFDTAAAEGFPDMPLERAQEELQIYRDPYLANREVFSSWEPEQDKTVGISDEDLEKLKANLEADKKAKEGGA